VILFGELNKEKATLCCATLKDNFSEQIQLIKGFKLPLGGLRVENAED
jgi:hypothetical protein